MPPKPESSDKLKLRLVDAPEGAEAPKLAVYAVDRSGATVHRAEVSASGEARVPAAALKKSEQVLVGPVAKDAAALDSSELLSFHAAHIQDVIAQGAELAIPIGQLIGFQRCVDGSVQRCLPYPWFIDSLVARASSFKLALEKTALASSALSESVIAFPPRPPFFPVCTRVCDGLVLIYRRTCCCEPWIIEDPRLQDLIDRLRQIVQQRPPIKFPPGPDPGPIFNPHVGPGPDPSPIDQLPFFTGATLDQASLNVEQDLHHLENLSGPEVADYITERAYLRPFWCHCGAAQLVGEGPIHPDGTFRVCWREPLIRLRPWCHDEYAFVVKQFVNGQTITIYNGLAAHQWFDSPTGNSLTSYDPRAIVCHDDPFPTEDGAFVVLEHIGAARSYRLKTPAQDAWDSVLAPADYNDGLLDPAASQAAAKGTYLDANWGGTLALHYHFSETMKGVDARYYRISAVKADAFGNPTGPRTTLSSAVAWLYYEVIPGPQILVQADTLGPQTVGTENNLYKIPYAADRDWQDDQYHGYLDTTVLGNDRYLVMLEVFDHAGNMIKPNGSSGPGAGKPFTFRRWSQPIGPLDNVPFSALTHMFWWDNRPSFAHIYDLRLSGVASTDECQFLVGTPSSTFSSGYRAYHPNPLFIHNHVMWWRRGLGGSSGTLINSNDNAGEPPAPLAVSPTETFGTMLGLDPHGSPNHRCSFSLNLDVYVKTNNGSGVLSYLDSSDQAAFALED